MRNLIKKTWVIGLAIIVLMLGVFFINLWIMSLKLLEPYTDDSILSLAGNISEGELLNIFAFILMLVFYLTIIPILLSVISFYKKNNWGFIVASLVFLGFETTIIFFQVFNHYLSTFALILTIINIFFILVVFALMILRSKQLVPAEASQKNMKAVIPGNTRIPLYVLLVEIIAILVFLTTFFIPVYGVTEYGSTYYAVIINVLLSGDTELATMICFLANFGLLLLILVYFAGTLSRYFFDKDRFIRQSKIFIAITFVSTLMFFLTGLAMYIYYTIEETAAETTGSIPLLLMLGVVFVFSILKGKYNSYYSVQNKEFKIGYARIEPLFYVVLLTAVTVLMLFLPIISISITAGAYNYVVDLTGFTILRDYMVLDPGYRTVAFILVVMLISVGIGLVIALSSYLAKYRRLNSIIKSVAGVNVFFVFIVAISGYYFQIANQIDKVIVSDISTFYGINLPDGLDFEYTVGTDAIYALIASIAILILMFIRKAFERDEMNLPGVNLQLENNAASGNAEAAANGLEDEYQTFDPCPAFTEIDSQAEAFKQDYEKRKALSVKETSLNGLVDFVVKYARNSRLHLSYTQESIAAFVAGLGASRLSILQGMSGTGKTSLPKIFSEAIFGNCEIVEVESSWKDKNELLGYYNEFSMKYTPKKFTLALYKASLNPEICTFILLDEMNLSRIEYYFSDFLSLMENEENNREIKLVNIKLARKEDDEAIDYLALENGNTLKVSPNIWFIGTANRDESTFVISDKVYDRAHTMNFTKRAPKVRNYSDPIPQQFYDYKTLEKLLDEARKKGDFDAENNELIKSVETLLAPYNISFGNRILKQIEDFVNIYMACFPDKNVKNEAIERILLSKVVSKLELKIIDDKETLELEFEKLKLNQCLAFIKRLDSE